MTKSSILTALDIGTYSVKALMGRRNRREENFEILAMAQIPSAGVRKGEIIKTKKVASVIQSSISELQKQSGLRVREYICNINGSHLVTVPSQGLISVSRADQKISEEDINRVLRQAEALNLPPNKEVLDIFPKEFIIDGEGGIKEPLGLHGFRLEVKALLIYVFSPVLENLSQALSSAGLQFNDDNIIVPSPLASAMSSLSFEQKELGVALIDIGAETTGLAVFEDGDLIHCHVIPLGSANITNDIAIGLRTEIETAERIKREFGFLPSKGKKERRKKTREKIEIPEKSLVYSKKALENIIESRVSEIFNYIQKELKKISKQELLPAGVVLTGGGSLLSGIEEYAKKTLKLPCRLAAPKDISGLPKDPVFSTAAGLLLEGWNLEKEGTKRGSSREGLGEKFRKILKIFLP